MYFNNPHHRCIVISEGGAEIFRHDNNAGQTKNLETDIVIALVKLKEDKRIDIDRFMMILRAYEHKLDLSDALDMMIDYALKTDKYKNILGLKQEQENKSIPVHEPMTDEQKQAVILGLSENPLNTIRAKQLISEPAMRMSKLSLE